MLTKTLFSFVPLFSFLTPICSTSLPSEMTVFASLMKDNPYRPPQDESSVHTKEPKEFHFDQSIRVMSFNILSDQSEDRENIWEIRKKCVSSMIRFHHADLIGLQEPSKEQLHDLKDQLPEFESFDGIYNPILFRKNRFKKLESGSFYLSPTPDQPSLGWDAKYPRTVCWVLLNDKKHNTSFYLFNTHLEYHGNIARGESVNLIKTKIAEISKNVPFILTGDFNLFPSLGGVETYEKLTDSFIDAQSIAQFPHHGPTGTWSGFKEPGQPGIKPDYIFISPRVEVYLHGILSDTFDGQFPSDHLPVVADLIIH